MFLIIFENGANSEEAIVMFYSWKIDYAFCKFSQHRFHTKRKKFVKSTKYYSVQMNESVRIQQFKPHK